MSPIAIHSRPMRARGMVRLTVVAACLVTGGCQLVAGLREPREEQLDGSVEADVAPPPPSTLRVDACDDGILDARPSSQPGVIAPIELVFSYLATERIAPKDAGVALCELSGFALRNVSCMPGYVEGGPYDAGNCRQPCSLTGGDASAGRDDALGDLIQFIRLKPGASAYPFQPVDALEQARGNTMVRITNYNGGADDDDVDVAFFALSGVESVQRPYPDAGMPDAYSPDAGAWNRLWDRKSYRAWTVDPDSIADFATVDSNYNGKAFVVQHVLVARGAVMPLSIAGFPVRLEQAILVGELHETSDHHWSLDHGRLGGDIPIELLRHRLPALAAKDPKVCDEVVTKGFSFACSALDRGSDRTKCDALSLGLSVAMVEGTLGLAYVDPLPDVDCGVLECK